MVALASVFVDVRPQTDKFEPQLRRQIDRVDGKRIGNQVGTRIGIGLHGAIGSAVSRSAKLFAVGFAAIQGAKVFTGFINDARESAKVSRLTAQVIKSTGGAARVTAGQVGDLASAISNKTGADDEAIQSGENLLLTFTNIRNGVGAGNDIFNQASAAIVDMSAALNDGAVTTNGLKSSSIQLGKALNSPVKGVTALQKVGVSFTDSQKEQIKTLVDSGHTMDAQKIILRELGKEFGGAAAAASDPLQRLRTVLGNVGEDVGGLLLPAVSKFANFLSDQAVPAVYAVAGALSSGFAGASGSSGILGFFQRLGQVAAKTLAFIRQTVIPGFQALQAAFSGEGITSDGFTGVMERIGVVLRSVVGYITATVIPALTRFGRAAGPVLVAVLRAVAGFITDRVVPALRAFGGFIVGTVVPAAQRLWAFLAKNLGPTFSALGQLIVTRIWPALQGLFVRFQQVWPTVRTVIVFVAKLIGTLLALAVVILGKVLPVVIRLAGPVFTLLFAAIGKIIGIVAALARIFVSAVRTIINVFLSMVGAILNGAARAFGWVPKLGDKLKSAAAKFNTFRDQVNKSLSGVKSRTVTVSAKLLASQAAVAGVGTGGTGGRNQRLATGGPVFGPGTATSDSIPAMLSKGEHVLTAKEVRAFGGHDAVMQMRKSVVQGFAAGGPVGFDIDTRLTGLAKFESAIASFNARVDAAARRLAILSGSGPFSPGLTGAVNFARSQSGKPYVWGGVGPGGYDCSGFVSALVNVVQGRRPYSRRFSTGTLPAGLFASGSGAFNIGWFTGNPGHVAATVNGVPMESRGGDGVVVGARSRGAGQSIFNRHGHLIGFARGGPVLPGDPPFDILDPRGKHYRPGLLEALQGARSFDSGGGMPPGFGVYHNGTGRTETVTPGKTMDAVVGELRALRRAVETAPIHRDDPRDVRRSQRYLNGRDPNGW